jgi:hypothetical protein
MLLCSGASDGAAAAAAAAAAAGLTAGGGRAGSSSILGKHAREGFAGSGQQLGDSLSKRMRRLMPPRSSTGNAGNANRGVVSADKHLAVGCRVAVFWRLDKVFYKVRQGLN